MLLEMPPRDRGQPLPQIQLLIGTSNASSVDSVTNFFGQTASTQIKQESPIKVPTALGEFYICIVKAFAVPKQ